MRDRWTWILFIYSLYAVTPANGHYKHEHVRTRRSSSCILKFGFQQIRLVKKCLRDESFAVANVFVAFQQRVAATRCVSTFIGDQLKQKMNSVLHCVRVSDHRSRDRAWILLSCRPYSDVKFREIFCHEIFLKYFKKFHDVLCIVQCNKVSKPVKR